MDPVGARLEGQGIARTHSSSIRLTTRAYTAGRSLRVALLIRPRASWAMAWALPERYWRWTVMVSVAMGAMMQIEPTMSTRRGCFTITWALGATIS